MGTDPSGAGPEDEPRGSCLSNLFWLSHVFKTNPVWHSVYRTGTGDKSSFVTNTIPPLSQWKSLDERQRKGGHLDPHSARVFLLNVRRQHRRGTRTSRKVFLSLTMMFHDDLSPMKISQLVQPKKKNYSPGISTVHVRYLKYYSSRVCFPHLLNSRGKFIPDSILKFHRLPRV